MLLALQNTKKNYEKLFTKNKQRETTEENKIFLPFVVCSSQFTECDRRVEEDEKISERVSLKFPRGTKYISNIMGLMRSSS